MRAVAPKVYNNWRDMLLSDLYLRALKLMEQRDREAVDPARRLATVKDSVREQLAPRARLRPRSTTFLDEMPERYFFTVPENDIALHFDLMRALGDRPLVMRNRHFPDLEFSEFIVVTRDRPGLFSKIAGALTANNLNILSARITTRAGGIALDVFRVSHLMDGGAMAMEEDRWQRVQRDLERVITGEQDIAQTRRRGASSAIAPDAASPAAWRPKSRSTIAPRNSSPCSTCSPRTASGSCSPSRIRCSSLGC